MYKGFNVEDLDARIQNLEQQISEERAWLSTDRMDISFGELIKEVGSFYL